MKKATFEVNGMSCGNCKQTIKSAVTKLEGVEEATVDLESEQVTVKFDKSKVELSAIKDEVRAAGYEVS
ncbi:hypothetical protein JCM16358_20070 [Halanaerocella petrolearia]